jgi:hypothetical protein
MKSSVSLFALINSILSAALSAAPPEPAPIVDPPDLIALREAYSASIAPIRTKMEESIKVRSAVRGGFAEGGGAGGGHESHRRDPAAPRGTRSLCRRELDDGLPEE